jgi:DNA-3-methyladenine glycosylase I
VTAARNDGVSAGQKPKPKPKPTAKAKAKAQSTLKSDVDASVRRCDWSGADPEMVAYHDTEWGVPVHDDDLHFEFLVLEGAQAGLSWSTILKRRGGYRKAFAGFDVKKVARFTPAKVEKLLTDPGIIRNRAKVEATVRNARAFLEVQNEFGSFDDYIWGFVGGRTIVNKWGRMGQLPAISPASEALSADLKRRGFGFVGPTVCYAHLQAAGLVNDHIVGCFRYAELTA